MLLTELDLIAGRPRHKQAWDALLKWVVLRCSRQRTAHIPNVFHIAYQTVSEDKGTKIKRPVFVLSDRFVENYGVAPALEPEAGVPEPVPGDELNFYQLAITFSESLSKDECYAALKEMLVAICEGCGQRRELRVDFGVGHLVCEDLYVGFEFARGADRSGRKMTPKGPSHDPMINARNIGERPELSLIGASSSILGKGGGKAGGGSALGGGGGSAIGGKGGATKLSEEEELKLFAEVDALDPEEQIDDEEPLSECSLPAAAIPGATQRRIGAALALQNEEIAARSVGEVGAALGARAAELEARLAATRASAAEMEALLLQSKLEEERAANANIEKQLAAAKQRQRNGKPPPPPPPPLPPAHRALLEPRPGEMGLGALEGSAIGSSKGGGGSRANGRGGGRGGGGGGGAARGKPPPPPPGPPVLSVGFGGGGPATLAPPAKQFARAAPTIQVAGGSSLLGKGGVGKTFSPPKVKAAAKAGSGVAVAPPLKPANYNPAPPPRDALAKGWQRNGKAPGADGAQKPPRPAGGLAPPFLSAPELSAAAMAAKLAAAKVIK